jgi:hypothetical protein
MYKYVHVCSQTHLRLALEEMDGKGNYARGFSEQENFRCYGDIVTCHFSVMSLLLF